jgi:5-methyltetrahydrofolate--homocysteine methyltransferase
MCIESSGCRFCELLVGANVRGPGVRCQSRIVSNWCRCQKKSGNGTSIVFTIVTIGDQASVEMQKLFETGDFTRYLYLHGLSVETAETLAEFVHKQIRTLLGTGGADSARVTDLFHQKYPGSRYSFGYPACPNLEDQDIEDQAKISKLLEPEKSIGVRLTEKYYLEPEQITSVIPVHHPQSKCFVA